jgi:hypothetical protein
MHSKLHITGKQLRTVTSELSTRPPEIGEGSQTQPLERDLTVAARNNWSNDLDGHQGAGCGFALHGGVRCSSPIPCTASDPARLDPNPLAGFGFGPPTEAASLLSYRAFDFCAAALTDVNHLNQAIGEFDRLA